MKKPKLTNDQIAEIQQKCRDGHGNAELASRYGISKMSVTKIRNNTYFQGKSRAEMKNLTKLTSDQVKQKILDGTRFDPVSGCWEWMCGKISTGYGNIVIDGKVFLTHRVSYAYFVGPLNDKMLVCHKCDNPSCCNPDHLFLGSDLDNMADKVLKGRNPSGDRHPQAVINGATAIKIVEMLKAGMTGRAIASTFGIKEGIVWNVKYGLAWNCATGIKQPEHVMPKFKRFAEK